MSRDADRHLLFGLLALQTGLVRQDQLVAAFHAWTTDKTRPLDEHMIALGYLNQAQRDAINGLIDIHAETHGGDMDESLSLLAAESSTLDRLAALLDADLKDSLGRVGRGVGFQAGESTSEGLRFRILRPHAKGGLGAVYVALDSELNREVALKQILDNRADDPGSRGRFLIEAEITGGLEHPGIVPVYGLGKYQDGRPFYAMRFVRGSTLKEAIKAFHKGPKSGPERSLEFRRLLKRFTDVCNAVEYAHSRGVIHRDIKPGNVIVGKHGETLVVDWGLAKALGESAPGTEERALKPSSASGSSETLPGQAMGTPAYMSPEQARGDLDALGPQSDVYSLGATLFHLLAGRAPFQGTVEEALKAVEAGDHQHPRAVDSSIDPALEAIVVKAMAREPADRYDSAGALAEDVDRWLADERVEAYPEPWTRATGRWLSRHRTSVSTAATACLVALIGLATISVMQARSNRALDLQRQRAEANEAEAIDAVKRFTDAITNNKQLKNTPELESLRKTLLQEPLSFFGKLRERLQAEGDPRPESLSRLARAAFSHAILIEDIGDKWDAIAVYRHVIEIYDRLARNHPTVIEHQADLAASFNNLGLLLEATGRADEARAAHQRSIAIQEALVRDHPTVVEHQVGLARSLHNLGELSGAAGRAYEARAAHRRAIDILEALVRDHPPMIEHQAGLANSLGDLGNLLDNTGHADEARAAYQRAIDIMEPLVRDHPTMVEHQADLARILTNLGILLVDAGHADEARAAYQRAIDIMEPLVRDHPTVIEHQAGLAWILFNLGALLHVTGHADEARAAYQRAIAILEPLVHEHPAVVEHQARLALSLDNLGMLLGATGHADEVLAARQRAIDLLEPLVRDHPDVVEYRASLANSLNNLGNLLGRTGHDDDALAAHQRAIAIQEPLVRDHPDVAEHQAKLAIYLNGLGVRLRFTGHDDDARAALRRAIAILEALARDHPETPERANSLGSAVNNLAAIDLETSRFAEARDQLLQAIDWQKKSLAADPGNSEYRESFELYLSNLILAQRGLGHEAEAARAEAELAEFRRNDPRLADLDARLEAVGKGEAPKGDAERLTLAQRAYGTERFALAARLWGEALDSNPKLADDRQAQHAYNAACAAALAAAGKGTDAPGDDAEKARLRGRALAWLKAELAVWTKFLETDQVKVKQAIAQILHHWREDPDLAGARGQAIDQLPESERAGWKALWEGVDELLRKAE